MSSNSVHKNAHNVQSLLYGMTVQMSGHIHNFSKWLLAAMTESGVNQSELSRRSGISKQHINGLLASASGRESKAKQPSVETVDNLAKALGKPIAEARLAAGWAVKADESTKTESSLLAVFRELPADRQEDLMAFAQALHRRHALLPGDDLEPIGKGKPNEKN